MNINVFIHIFFCLFNLVGIIGGLWVIASISINSFPRKAKRFQKKFAFFPVFSTYSQKTIWLKFYYCHQDFGPGVCLGGNVEYHYNEEDGTLSFSSRRGSYFPSYKTKWVGNFLFSYRQYLRAEGWRSVKKTKIEEEKRIGDLEKFFGKDFLKD